MNGKGIPRDASRIENQIANLAKEDVGANEIEITIVHVGVAFEEAHVRRSKVGCSLDDGHIIGVANELSVVVVDDGASNKIGPGWEVDHGGRLGASDALVADTTVSNADRGVDGIRVISGWTSQYLCADE